MSVDDALALLGEQRPAWWLQYEDGSWAPVWEDGRIGAAFTIPDLLQIARHDLMALEGMGLAVEVIDVEPLSVVDTEPDHEGEHGHQFALAPFDTR